MSLNRPGCPFGRGPRRELAMNGMIRSDQRLAQACATLWLQRWGIRFLLLGCCLAVAAGAPRRSVAQEAIDPGAMGALQLAKHHYQKGHFDKAARLFLEAFSIQPRAEFLFNAARAYHRGMKLKEAQKRYRECLVLKDVTPTVVKRIRLHLSEVIAIQNALAAARKGGKEEAAALTPKKAAAAEPGLEGVTHVKAVDEGDAKPTQPAAKKPETKPAAPPKPQVQPKPATKPEPPPKTEPTVVHKGVVGGWMAPAGWASAAVGAISAGVGAWLYVGARDDKAALEERSGRLSPNGTVSGIYEKDFEADKASVESGLLGGGALIGVGVAALGAGLGLVALAPDDATLSLDLGPGRRGLLACWRF